MSSAQEHRLKCPQCGAEQDVLVYSSINVTIDPSLRDRLLAAELNLLTCHACGNNALIDTSLLYHDMEKQFCVQYYPQDSINDADFIKQFDQDGNPKDWGMAGPLAGPQFAVPQYLSRPHIVFDLNEMIRYILFRERLRP